MNRLKTIILALLILLGVSSGLSKVLQTRPEMAFFHDEMGFAANAIVLFGLAQLLAGIMMAVNKIRIAGTSLLAATFSASTIVLFLAGKTLLGLVSLLPIAMAIFLIRQNIEPVPKPWPANRHARNSDS